MTCSRRQPIRFAQDVMEGRRRHHPLAAVAAGMPRHREAQEFGIEPMAQIEDGLLDEAER